MNERVFTVASSELVFGEGATDELGAHVVARGCRHVLLLTDPRLAALPPVERAIRSLEGADVSVDVFDGVAVEPTDASFLAAADAAARRAYDGFVAVGGGSTIDTAKAASLYSSYPDDLLAYVNPPIGAGKPPPGPLRPLFAVPTTAGTGSETTGVAIFDLPSLHAKTGIAHRGLRPTMGIVDPLNTMTMPPLVTAAGAFDVLCHALESFTALPFDRRPRPESPLARPAYQGANPFSDVWAERSIGLVVDALPKVVADPAGTAARTDMALAATCAGIGFGNAGVHLPHGMSYAVSGGRHRYRPAGYPDDHPLVPHGISVVLSAPAVFRWTASAAPDRHRRAAGFLGADVTGLPDDEVGEAIADVLVRFMRLTGLPLGLREVGYDEGDAEALADATLPQHRVTKLSPRPASRDDLVELFRASMAYS
jgi:hydroxyacid-oxoacid transhydrogenase